MGSCGIVVFCRPFSRLPEPWSCPLEFSSIRIRVSYGESLFTLIALNEHWKKLWWTKFNSLDRQFTSLQSIIHHKSCKIDCGEIVAHCSDVTMKRKHIVVFYTFQACAKCSPMRRWSRPLSSLDGNLLPNEEVGAAISRMKNPPYLTVCQL